MIILEYLKKKIILIVTILFSLFFMSLILYLYNIKFEIIYYQLVYFLVIFILYFIYDYYIFRKNIIELKFLLENIHNTEIKIYKNNDIEKNLYLKILKKLKTENIKIIEKSVIEKNNIVDYYTQWIHQIKTPISALSFLIENDSTENKKYFESELFKIEQYVDMVMTYLRLDSEYNDFHIEEVDVEKLVNRVIKKYRNIFIAKKITVKNDINLKVISDKKWLEVVFEQLLSNALKYTKKEGSIQFYSKENIIYIKDNGIGIKEDNIPKIFEKGYTGFNGRKNKKSSGLGLYLVKKTLDKLGHNIKIISEVNKGTEVLLVFEKENIKNFCI